MCSLKKSKQMTKPCKLPWDLLGEMCHMTTTVFLAVGRRDPCSEHRRNLLVSCSVFICSWSFVTDFYVPEPLLQVCAMQRVPSRLEVTCLVCTGGWKMLLTVCREVALCSACFPTPTAVTGWLLVRYRGRLRNIHACDFILQNPFLLAKRCF